MAVIIRSTGSDVPSVFLEFVLSWMLIPQALLPLIALLYASGIIQDEQEDQTITYLLIRPIPKWLLYIVKMFATWTTTVVLTVLLTVITYIAIYGHSGFEFSNAVERCLIACGIHALAVIAYCSVFGLLSVLTKRVLLVGVLYTAIVEGLLANLPLSVRMATVIYYTRIIAYRSMSFAVTWPGGNEDDVAAIAWYFDPLKDPNLASHPQRSTCIWILVAAAVLFTIAAGLLCAGREFHVKTPEKE
jgi:ABC-2 type transport system permease protein